MIHSMPIAMTLLTFMIFYQSISGFTLGGIVVDRHDRPVAGAIVTLSGAATPQCTTDAAGRFRISLAATVRCSSPATPPAAVRVCRNGLIVLHNPLSQLAELTLFDLRGQMIRKLQKGMLAPGTYSFPFTAPAGGQLLILSARIGSTTATLRIPGVSGNLIHLHGSVEKGLSLRAQTAADSLYVTHSSYDAAATAIVPPYDSIVVRLFKKLNFTIPDTLAIGDTLSFRAEGATLALDSIVDKRCPCNVLCDWEGNASLYFTVNIFGTQSHDTLETYSNREFTGNGYSLKLLSVNPSCPQSDRTRYSVAVVLRPIPTPGKSLFLEHFLTKSGTHISGTCPMMMIDFPTYSHSERPDGLVVLDVGQNRDVGSARIIFGDGMALTGDAGGGIASALTGVDSLPYKRNNFAIDSIRNDGTVHITYSGEAIILAPGKTWVHNDTIRSPRYDTLPGSSMIDCLADYTYNDRITNFGFLGPDQIVP